MEIEQKSNIGALIGSIIVIIILVLGGVYLWVSKISMDSATAKQQEALEQLQAAVLEADKALGNIEKDIGINGVQNLDLVNVVEEVK